MAKFQKGKTVRKAKADMVFPLERENYIILGIGLLLIIFGYVALSEKSVEGFLPLTVAPILLTLGYCVFVPLGILYRKKEKKVEEPQQETVQA